MLLENGAKIVPLGARASVVLLLGRRSLDVLIYLAERPGEIVAENKLMDRAWSGATVEEARLGVHMAVIRKAVGIE